MNALKGLIKLIAAIVILSGIIALPAMARDTNQPVDQTSRETAVRERFANNTLNGVVKARTLIGKTLSKDQRKEIYAIAYRSSGEIIVLLKKSGKFDEYYTQIHDKDICDIDKRALLADTIEEVRALMFKQLGIVQTRYPELYIWILQSDEVDDITTKMLRDIANIINK